MSASLEITVLRDTATPALARLARFATAPPVRQRMAEACANLTRSHIMALGINKNRWPTTHFWPEVAGNVQTRMVGTGSFVISIDHPTKPGAVRYQYQGGEIHMKDKLLTIPARAEFYGHRAGEFNNLRFGMFKNGTKFLYIDKGGTKRGGKNVKGGKRGCSTYGGTGARSAMMVAYWLVESVSKRLTKR